MRRSFGKVWNCIVALGLLVAGDGVRGAEPAAAVPVENKDVTLPALRTLAGEPVDTAELLRAHGRTAVVFYSAECPISQQYVNGIEELRRDFAGKDVGWTAVFPNARESNAVVKDHAAEYGLKLPPLRDPEGKLAERWRVEVCPAVCVVAADGKIVYRGRIDDRFSRRGAAAGAVRREDLRLALTESLAGKPIAVPETTPIGCPLNPHRPRPQGAGRVTFAADVAPLLAKHCVECHRPGGAGPFALTTYDEAARWAEDLAALTASGDMPPWKPVAGHGDFVGARVLSPAERAVFSEWVAAGSPAGSEKTSPIVPAETVKLPAPDLILAPQSPYRLAATGEDVYRCFVLPTHFAEDRYVTGLDVRPGNGRVVHHVLLFVDVTEQSADLDAADEGEGYAVGQGFPGFLPAGGLGGWAPGNRPHFLPPGMGRPLPKGAKVVLQVHYHKTGKEELDRTEVGLYLAPGPVPHPVRAVPVLPTGGPWGGMRIPAGAANHAVTARLTLPWDLLAVSVTPHMHLLGKDMRVDATFPDGTRRPLVRVDRWDFNWQETYAYREPLRLPKGTILDLTAHFDNSAANPHNPSRPPREVGWGEQTHDEMAIAFFEMTPAGPGPLPTAWRADNRTGLMLEILRAQQPEGSPLRQLLSLPLRR